MTTLPSLPINNEWKRRLDLADRGAPDLYENLESIRDTPHAGAIRATLEELGASAVFCVQGVPTIVIVALKEYDRAAIVDLHAALWNQGLANLLLVIADDTVRAFSLSRTPYSDPGDEFERLCLVETLRGTDDALALKGIIYGAESGRFWEEHAEYFKPKERVDQVLLENLINSHRLLCEEGLDSEPAQALLIQAMFISYLEDREIISTEYFQAATKNKVGSFSNLLEGGHVALLKDLFSTLRKDFNGDLFVAPCSFEPNASPPRVSREHLAVLARFRDGHEDMSHGQLRFWGYDFKHIPVELISAVYDRFLGEKEDERREHGAYYTPMFLADTVVSQVWDSLSAKAKDGGNFLDPACGSGVFLVRSFQRLCEHWRETHTARTIRWDSLLNLLARLHGWDLNGGAVRVAVFSLYIALLEQVSPPDIRSLIKKGKVLPELWGKTLKCQDFFAVDPAKTSFEVVIGNPPWTSRRGPSRASIHWCEENDVPMPGGEDAWAFTWKSVKHLTADGLVAFLLPAMGFLHNHSDTSIEARSHLLKTTRIRRIVNFADLRFQLFDGAIRPAALVIFSAALPDKPFYRFDYWAPKSDLNLKVKRLITLTTSDKHFVTSKAAIENPFIFKHRLWMSEPDAKLFNYLSAFPKLGSLIEDFGRQSRSRTVKSGGWMIGQGFQPHNPSSGGSYQTSDYVSKIPNLPIASYQPLAQSVAGLKPAASSRVRRKGFERGFEGPRILVPQGVSVSQMRLRASYVETPLTFQHILQAIVVPKGAERRAKILTGLLNSKVAIWFAFHGTSSFGSDRPKVQQAELMQLPFPEPNDLPEPDRSLKAAKGLVAIIDKAMAAATAPFSLQSDSDAALNTLDALAYEYFCLSKEEIKLIEDAIRFVLPAVQPHQGTFPAIWKSSIETERRIYADALCDSLNSWLAESNSVTAQLAAHNADLAVLKLTLGEKQPKSAYSERDDHEVREVLARLFKSMQHKLPGNFQLMPDFRIFEGKNLYLVKPMQLRFWLQSTALADASAIALDLQDCVGTRKKRSRA